MARIEVSAGYELLWREALLRALRLGRYAHTHSSDDEQYYKGDQIRSGRPIVRPALSQGLFRHGDKEAALVTLHQEGYGVVVVSLGESVAYLLH